MATNYRNFATPTPNLGVYGAAQRLTKAGLIESPYEAWTMPNEVTLRKAQPTVFDVHVNVPNTMFSIAYIQSQTNFRAAEIFPLIPVMKKSDYYVSYTKDYWFTNEAQVRLDGAETTGTGYGLKMTNTYMCDVWGLHVDLGDAVAANADAPLNMQRDISLFLTQKLLLAREMQFVNNYFTDVWTNTVTGGAYGGSPNFVYWDDQVNSTPIEDIRKYRLEMAMATGYVPNTLVIGPEVYEALIVHPEILERIKYGGTPGSPAIISEQALAQVLSIDRVIIPMCVVNSAQEGSATPSMGFAYGKDALLCYSNPTPSILTPSAGYTFGWNGYLSSGGPYQDIVGSGGAGWFAVRNFRMEWRRAMRMEAEMAMGMELIAQDLGYFLSGCVSSTWE
jgi:hypothetical protein